MEDKIFDNAPVESEDIDVANGDIDNESEDVEDKESEVTDTNNIDYVPSTKPQKAPMFYIEPKKDGCNRNDSTLLLSKKVGFIGLVSFLILSIIFGAITRVWENSLNLIFMALAVLSYGVQDILHLVAISRCNCRECTATRSKLKLVITVCVLTAVVLIVLAVLKMLGFIGK